MKKSLISAITAVALLGGAVYANEKAPANASAKEVSRVAVSNAKNDAKSNQTNLVKEAIDSLKLAHDALMSLDQKDTKKATENIEKALGKLEVILASDKVPSLLPIDNLVTINEFIGTADQVKAATKLAKELLGEGKVQQARAILMPLVSEIDATVVSLPLASYPDALKLAAKYIDNNKIEEAKKVLGLALSTFDRVTHVIPIPLIKATDLIAAASDIAQKDPKRAVMYLDAASDSLDVAEALGYVSKSETTYKMLHESIKAVKKEVEGKNKAEKLFDDLKAKLKEFKEKVFTPSADKNNSKSAKSKDKK